MENKNYTNLKFKHSEITGKILGCAMKVHSALGPGFQEAIYQRCLEIEFRESNIPYEREKEIPVYYHDIKVGTRRVDFLVDGKVMVELKALSTIEDTHIAQTINYLEAYKLEVGLLLNFGSRSLTYKRLIKDKYYKQRNP